MRPKKILTHQSDFALSNRLRKLNGPIRSKTEDERRIIKELKDAKELALIKHREAQRKFIIGRNTKQTSLGGGQTE